MYWLSCLRLFFLCFKKMQYYPPRLLFNVIFRALVRVLFLKYQYYLLFVLILRRANFSRGRRTCGVLSRFYR